MEFMNRGSVQPQHSNQPAPSTANAASGRSKMKDSMRSMRVFSVALMFSVTVLLLALASSLFFGTAAGEHTFLKKKQMQAVFLNGGQVYFGRISSLNSEYVRLYDIYYLRVNQQVQPGENTAANDVSLVKLGCELHGPTDEMVINRDQVVFWENLKDDGQVAQAVSDYKKANPEGQKCAQPTDNTSTDTNQDQ